MKQNKGTSNERIWSKSFISIFIVNFVMSMGQFMMNTLIPKYAYQLGGTAAITGVVAGVFAVTALGIRPVAGPAMDFFRKNRLLSISVGIITVTFIFYGFARNIGMLIAARLMHGIGIGMSAPLCLAIASNSLPDSKIASGLGMFSLGGAIATASGPTLGLKLAATIGYSNTFFICASLMAASFALTFMLKNDTPQVSGRFRINLKQALAPEVLLPTLVMFFQIIAFSGINSFIAIFGEKCGVEDIGLFFTANALTLLLVRPVSGRIADRYGIDKTIIPGFILFIGALIFISFSRTLPMFILAGVVTAIGFGISEPLLQAMNMQLVPKARRGAAGNTNYLGIDFGFLIGPTLAGAVISVVENSTGSEIQGIAVMYRVMIIPVIVALVIFARNRKKLRERIRALRTE
ncbi:MAG: MFS transporter [Clostridiales bacterium]|jgi:MFS family permease|nr:MFS transporter [Clostridiales bacterium]